MFGTPCARCIWTTVRLLHSATSVQRHSGPDAINLSNTWTRAKHCQTVDQQALTVCLLHTPLYLQSQRSDHREEGNAQDAEMGNSGGEDEELEEEEYEDGVIDDDETLLEEDHDTWK